MIEVAYWSLFFLPTVLRYGAHCYLQVGLGLSFSLSWNTRSLARPWRSSGPRWATVKWVGRFAVEQEASVGAKRDISRMVKKLKQPKEWRP
jgi:hypothetical protein